MIQAEFLINDRDVPVIAAAIHNGHHLREELLPLLAISEEDRLREEDPLTGRWTGVVDNRIIVETSRFEVDLNRDRKSAVYICPEEAWGLSVWKQPPNAAVVARSLEAHDAFYQKLECVLKEFQEYHGKFVILDLHAYNHRRNGPGAPGADPQLNPDVNLGTKTMDRSRWAPLIDRFIGDLKNFDFMGGFLDVRENIKFYGRHFPQWIHRKFPESACVLSLEFKKFFMDEWTGMPDDASMTAIMLALRSVLPGLMDELRKS